MMPYPPEVDASRDVSASLVEAPDGRLIGLRRKGVGCWRGIPYATPPLGALRFRAPQAPEPWPGLRDARSFGASAAQPSSPAERLLGLGGHVASSEDCLTLNVWSRGPGGLSRPVMVWVHGGSFLTGAGSDSLYDGHDFARRGDVVVVTLNYRLGLLGFLHLGSPGNDDAENNLGLRDIVAALTWVSRSIAAFGGDPRQVTVFGQSAGAMAIGALLGAPGARGLFHRAILQSGAAQHVHDPADAARVRRAVLGTRDVTPTDLARLRSLPVERVVALGAGAGTTASLLRLPFQPMVDGDVLPRRPLAAVGEGSAAGVPLLVGTVRDELAPYRLLVERDRSPRWRRSLRRWRALLELATAIGPRQFWHLRATYGEAEDGLWSCLGDIAFRWPALALLKTQQPHAPVFAYRFDWRSGAYGGRLGACHAVDLPFVWNAIGTADAAVLTRDEPTSRALAITMQDAWIAFARTGHPGTVALGDWPRYDATRRSTMIFDTTCRIASDPGRDERLAWSDVDCGRARSRTQRA